MPRRSTAPAPGSTSHSSRSAGSEAPASTSAASRRRSSSRRPTCTAPSARRRASASTPASPSLDWSVTQQRKQAVVDELVGGIGQLLKGRKVTVYDGYGRLHAGRTVSVDPGDGGERFEISGDAVIIAAGSETRTIPGFDVDGTIVMTSDEVLSMPQVPGTAVVIGGGAIGCEFASMMSDLGSQVTVLEALPKILPGCDKDVTSVVERSFKKRGIEVRTGVKVTGHEPGDGGTVVNLEGADPIKTDVVVVSVGRKPATADLGLDGTQVQVDERGFVVVDEVCRTGEDGVWAVGDCIATPQLAHVGFAEAMVAIHGILGEQAVAIDYGKVPWGIYCRPEVAFAGHSEQSAKEAGYDVVASKHRYSANSRAKIIGDQEGLVKVDRGEEPRRHRRHDPRRPHGGPVGHRAARPGLPGRQLGGHRRRGGRIHPAAPDAVRAVRRHGAGPHRPAAALTRTTTTEAEA